MGEIPRVCKFDNKKFENYAEKLDGYNKTYTEVITKYADSDANNAKPYAVDSFDYDKRTAEAKKCQGFAATWFDCNETADLVLKNMINENIGLTEKFDYQDHKTDTSKWKIEEQIGNLYLIKTNCDNSVNLYDETYNITEQEHLITAPTDIIESECFNVVVQPQPVDK